MVIFKMQKASVEVLNKTPLPMAVCIALSSVHRSLYVEKNMAIYKRCSSCGKRLLEGTRCDCRKKRYKEYDKFYRDKKSKEFYNSREWLEARRESIETSDHMDVYIYMTTGEVKLAETVHHIIPLRDDWDKRTDQSNLMPLSHDTHSMIEQMYKKDKPGMEKRLKIMLEAFKKGEGGGQNVF